MDIYEKINKRFKNKDEYIVIAINREYIQSFVEANFDRRLTVSQLNELSFSVWDESDESLMNWLSPAVKMLIDNSERKHKK